MAHAERRSFHMDDDPPMERAERRSFHRFDTMLPVVVEPDGGGVCRLVVRNLSEGGALVETDAPLPLGTQLRLSFETLPGIGSVVALGTVRNHYHLQYGGDRTLTGMGVRFRTFETGESEVELAGWLRRLDRLH